MREDYVPLELIQLDQENLRTGDTSSPREAIQAVINQQALKNYNKLERIGEHIAQYGLSPIELTLLIPDDENEGFYIVKEGNRRIAALKLLERPDLADDERVRKRFEALASKYSPENNRKIRSIIFDTEEEAMTWIELRHSTKLEGAGQEKWDSVAHENADVKKGKYRRGRAVLDFLKKYGVDTEAYEENRKKHKKTTAIDRILEAGGMRSVLGVFIKTDGTITFENGDFRAGIRLLKHLMDEMTLTDFNTDDVYSREAREYFIEQFADMSVKTAEIPEPAPAPSTINGSFPTGTPPEPTVTSVSTGSGGSTGQSSTQTSTHAGNPEAGTSKPVGGRVKGARKPLGKEPTARKTLAQTSNGERYRIHDPRLRSLYNEIKKLDVDEYTSVAACMVRVFLDLSVTHFLIESGVPTPTPGKAWDEWDVRLRQKCEAAVKYLDPGKGNPELDLTRKIGDEGYLHSIENLNKYIHERSADPVPIEVKKIWDRYHPFFKLMFKKLDGK